MEHRGLRGLRKLQDLALIHLVMERDEREGRGRFRPNLQWLREPPLSPDESAALKSMENVRLPIFVTRAVSPSLKTDFKYSDPRLAELSGSSSDPIPIMEWLGHWTGCRCSIFGSDFRRHNESHALV